MPPPRKRSSDWDALLANEPPPPKASERPRAAKHRLRVRPGDTPPRPPAERPRHRHRDSTAAPSPSNSPRRPRRTNDRTGDAPSPNRKPRHGHPHQQPRQPRRSHPSPASPSGRRRSEPRSSEPTSVSPASRVAVLPADTRPSGDRGDVADGAGGAEPSPMPAMIPPDVVLPEAESQHRLGPQSAERIRRGSTGPIRSASRFSRAATGKNKRSSLTQRIRVAPTTAQGKDKRRNNKVTPMPLFESAPTAVHKTRARRVSDILDGDETVSRILQLSQASSSQISTANEPTGDPGAHRSFRMVIAGLFAEMAVYNVVGPPLARRFPDAKKETDFKNWKWDLLYSRFPTAITWASAVYSLTMFTVMLLALTDEPEALVLVMSIHGAHTVVNAVLSLISRRERLWSEVLHPGLLWSVGMRLFGVLGINLALALKTASTDKALFLSPLITATLLCVVLVLLEVVAFVFPLVTMVSLATLDLCSLITIGTFEVIKGWHSTGQVAVILMFFLGISLLAVTGLKLDDRSRREMYLTLDTHDKITSELAEERLAVQLKNAAPHDFTENIERLLARGLPAQHKAVPVEIARHRVDLREIVGRGAFGDVRLGQLTTAEHGETAVAIKTYNKKKDTHNSDGGSALTMLLEEATLMAQFKHPNVIRLLGVCTAGSLEGLTAMILMEYAEKGPLQKYIRKNRQFQVLTDVTKLTMSLDIASGMRYLSELNFVHRDLAARNVLVMGNFTCKVADFGLSRFMGRKGNYYRSTGGVLPIRWSPIEALEQNKFTSASDVWSFGVVVYEIFSGAAKPYAKLTNQEVWLKVKAGFRLPKPPDCPEVVYKSIMRQCWASRPADRPTFATLVTLIDSELRKSGSVRPSSAMSSLSDMSGMSGMSALTMASDPLDSPSPSRAESNLWWDRNSTVEQLDLYNDDDFLAMMLGDVEMNNRKEATDIASITSDRDEVTRISDMTMAIPGATTLAKSPRSTTQLRSGPALFRGATPESQKPVPPPRPSICRTGSEQGSAGEVYDNVYSAGVRRGSESTASDGLGGTYSSGSRNTDLYETPQPRQG